MKQFSGCRDSEPRVPGSTICAGTTGADRFRSLVAIAVLALILMAMSGCATIFRLQADFVAPMVSEMIVKGPDAENLRVVREGMAANAILTSALAKISPTNRSLLKDTSFIYCCYGLLVEDEEPEFAIELFAVGRQYGMDALKTNRNFRKGLAKGGRIPDLVGSLGRGYAETLCWAGLNTGLWILHNMDDPSALVALADALALVERSIELDGDYYFGVGKAFLAAYYAQIPDYFGTGGGPDAARKMFAEARAVTGGRLLLVDVYEARFLMSQLRDRQGFREIMERVLDADPDILEGAQAFTALAKVKAQYLLEHMDDFF